MVKSGVEGERQGEPGADFILLVLPGRPPEQDIYILD